MSIPKNITKEDILKAINLITVSDIPHNRLSKEYYLKYGEKTLPPKFVISIANKFANSIELDSNLFNAIEAKNFLKKMNFIIKTNNKKEIPKYWIEKTIVKNRKDREYGERALGKALWSPQRGKPNKKTGKTADIYKNMRLVGPGDIILHLIDNEKIIGISRVKKSAIETTGVKGTDWDRPSYLISLVDYTILSKPIDRDIILSKSNKNILIEISENSEVFYNRKLNLREGAYLTPCTTELLKLINEMNKIISSNDLPLIEDIQFENSKSKFNDPFKIDVFHKTCSNSGLKYTKQLITRYISSLASKPFVLLSGLSGSGKTKLAQAFAQWICQDDSQYCIVPVGADWTNREPLLGFPNALKPDEYIKPDNDALDVIIQANSNPDLPYFLILDEMNLSHVERYFADFLSVMESHEEIPLFAEGTVNNGVPSKLALPSNLFIIGTINIDETTYMFSPKVLDRANTIEFRVTKSEIENFFENQKEVEMSELTTKGASMASSFLDLSQNRDFEEHDMKQINKTLISFFEQLKKAGAEFGYRSANEIIRLINQLTVIDESLSDNEKLDIAIMQKLLPKLHGSRRKLTPILITLGVFCIDNEKIKDIEKEVFGADDFDSNENVKYPLSLEKITRMYKGAVDNGFASYAEA
ncbi:MAG: hypothetical protein K8S00_05850 [Bacteroidales bacterium]|nr:hypothetical protein [Bacteroidales bacterium]